MNLNKVGTLVALLLFGGMYSCSKDSLAPVQVVEEQARAIISIDGTLQVPTEDNEARMTFSGKKKDGQWNGVALNFAKGEKVTAHLFFKQGTKTGVTTADMVIGEYDATNRTYPAKAQNVVVPSGIDVNDKTNPIEVAGAIGVSGINSQGVATVPSSGAMYDKYKNYTVPMYFPLTRMNGEVIGATFRLYGALVSVEIRNRYGSVYKPKEVVFTSEAFTTEGAMDLSVAQGETRPAWTSAQGATDKKRVRLLWGDVAKNSNKDFYIWVKPNVSFQPNGKNNSPLADGLRVEVRSATQASATTLEIQPDISFFVKVQKVLQEEKVHRLRVVENPKPGGLIFTEVFMGDTREQAIWEFFNSSDQSIRLNDYKLAIARWDGSNLVEQNLIFIKGLSSVVLIDRDSGIVHKNGASLDYVNPNKNYILRSGESIVFLTGLVKYNERDLMTRRTNLRYVIHLRAGTLLEKDALPFYVPEGHMHMLKDKDGKIEDVFFRLRDENGRDNKVNFSLPSAGFYRKPDRNIPRQFMELGYDSDWVVRERTETTDIGRRFSYFGAVGSVQWADADWMTGPDRGNDWRDGWWTFKPIKVLNELRTNDGRVTYSWKDNGDIYTPPSPWTRQRAKEDYIWK